MHEACGKAAGIGLDAADQDALELPGLEAADELNWREIAMLDEHVVVLDDWVVGRSELPSKLPLEWHHRVVVPLDSRYRVHGWGEPGNPVHRPRGRAEAGLDINHEECLFHGVLAGVCPVTTPDLVKLLLQAPLWLGRAASILIDSSSNPRQNCSIEH